MSDLAPLLQTPRGPENSDYNPDYISYAPTDCANFVSQIMYAGGWDEVGVHYWSNDAWYYNHVWGNYHWLEGNSRTWSSAEHFFQFARGHRTTSRNGVWNLQMGDAASADTTGDGLRNHTMFVEWRSSTGMPYLTYHSTNRNFKSLAWVLENSDWGWYTHRTH